MADRFGTDRLVAEHKTTGLYVESPALTGIAVWFCAAVTTMFGAMAYAVDAMTQSGVDQSSWLPVRSRPYSGGDYATAANGERFPIAERTRLGSLDELSGPCAPDTHDHGLRRRQ